MTPRFQAAIKPLLVCGLLLTSNTGSSNDDLEQVGTILQILLPSAAYAKTWIDDDPEGREQFYKSGTGTLITTLGMKNFVVKVRPSEFNDQSFPSGHTSASFMGASFLQRRYGWAWGAPAYALASLVGYSRIDAQAHYADDVLAGANIAILYSIYFVTPQDSAIQVTPYTKGDESGLSLSYSNNTKSSRNIGAARDANFIYSFLFGPSYINDLKVKSGESSSEVNVGHFDARIPLTTTRIIFDYKFDKNWEWSNSFFPFEYRNTVVLDEDVPDVNISLNTGDEVSLQYRHYEVNSSIKYKILKSDIYYIYAGIGAAIKQVRQTITNNSLSQSTSFESYLSVPLINLSGEIYMNQYWSLFGLYEIGKWKNNEVTRYSYGLKGIMNKNWTASFAASEYYGSGVNSDGASDTIDVDTFMFIIGYQW